MTTATAPLPVSCSRNSSAKALWRLSARRTMDRSPRNSRTDITLLILAWWMAGLDGLSERSRQAAASRVFQSGGNSFAWGAALGAYALKHCPKGLAVLHDTTSRGHGRVCGVQ